jgi:hypothetical protein
VPGGPFLVELAIATLVAPLVFVALVGIALVRRNRGIPPGPGTWAALSVATGLTLGILLAAATFDPVVAAPILVAGLAVVAGLWRRRRRRSAGLVLAALAVPTAAVAAASGPGQEPLALVAALAFVVGAGVTLGANDRPPLPSADAQPGLPGSRRIGNVAAAILEASTVGPIGVPVLAMLVALVATWLVVPVLLGLVAPELPRLASTVAASVVGALVAAEAYVRSFPTRSRLAFEAFSWLGEHDLAAARAYGRVPTTRSDAERWLAKHPETPEAAWLRVEVLLLAGCHDEAVRVAREMPDGTPLERWTKAADLDLAEWMRGGPGELRALEDATRGLPAGSDDRLRAEVALATARVRRRLADGRTTSGDALDPLVEVRAALGSRANGQLGRAVRPRLLPILLASGLILSIALEVIEGPALPLY